MISMQELFREKQIRLFKFEEFQLQEFVEVSKNESIAFKTPYIAVFKKKLKKKLINGLSKIQTTITALII